ncbi:MAG: hypothetical protein F4017_06860 [Acidimicrobiaceae bacterium]|nr:hypothetical protein [Acidimicrobiaceae bacterium]
MPRPDCGAHATRRRPCSEPGMHLRLNGRLGPLGLRDAVDELLGEAPDDILRRDHGCYKIFKLSGILIVWHEPHTDAGATFNHDSSGAGFARQRDAPAFAAVTNGLPTTSGVVVSVYYHSQNRPVRHGQLDGNALGEFRESSLLLDVKVAHQTGLREQMHDDVLVIRPLYEQHTVRGSTRQSHRAVT